MTRNGNQDDMTPEGHILHEGNEHERVPLFLRVCTFFLVYPEVLVILVLVILALFGVASSG